MRTESWTVQFFFKINVEIKSKFYKRFGILFDGSSEISEELVS